MSQSVKFIVLLVLATVCLLVAAATVKAHEFCRYMESNVFMEYNLWGDEFGTGTGGLPMHDAEQKFGCHACRWFDGRLNITAPGIGPRGWAVWAFHENPNPADLTGAWVVTGWVGSNVNEWHADADGKLYQANNTLFDKLTYHGDGYLAIDFKRPMDTIDGQISNKPELVSPYFKFKNQQQTVILMYTSKGPIPASLDKVSFDTMEHRVAYKFNFFDLSQTQKDLTSRICAVPSNPPQLGTNLNKPFTAVTLEMQKPKPQPSPSTGGNGTDPKGSTGGNGDGTGGKPSTSHNGSSDVQQNSFVALILSALCGLAGIAVLVFA